MRHSVERARTATHVVSSLSRCADGAAGRHATGRLLWRAQAGPQLPTRPVLQRAQPRLPPGFRWIAVRPGAGPPLRRGRRPLGPTPRYAAIPRWSLADRVPQASSASPDAPVKTGPRPEMVRVLLFATQLVLGGAALIYAAAVRAADRQPQHAAELAGGGHRGLGGRRREFGGHGDDAGLLRGTRSCG